MEYVGWIFGMMSFFWCCSLSGKISRLERLLKEQSGELPSRENIREVLEQHKGKVMALTFYETDFDLFDPADDCLLLDMDESWVFVRENPGKKNEKEKLFPLASIKSVTLK